MLHALRFLGLGFAFAIGFHTEWGNPFDIIEAPSSYEDTTDDEDKRTPTQTPRDGEDAPSKRYGQLIYAVQVFSNGL